jgi:tripartite-type tricarboxylate transporter receptor subunit TctC
MDAANRRPPATSPIRRRPLAAGAAALAAALAAARSARAQAAEWPSRTLRIIVPFAPGGPVEVPTRVIAERLSQRLGQSVIVEARPGAGGTIGTKAVVQANDPHLLLSTTSAVVIAPALAQNAGYDPVADLAPITLISELPLVFATRAESGIRDLDDLLRRARAEPGRISYASAGVGSTTHLVGALFCYRAGVDLLHVPYRGAAQSAMAAFAGDTDLVVVGTLEAMPHIREGRLRAVAISTAERVAVLPDVPSLAERLPGFAITIWYAMFGPRALPVEAVRRIVSELGPVRAPDTPLAQRFAAAGGRLLLDGPEPLAARIRQELPQWRELSAATGLRLE